ncbi:MAG: hypothetical protein KME60_19510 [Cyanomargarita calcarea GSE-NOS-MK-12-04C]|jgi:hypothetical protein|uniref:Uncharacterized protein n=1 Tax=Cyanomargarita calcarea GSE-NOS-MK-12-04C TaxID=2839659 RepID=A0A951UW37_9CYAN|nr:hypothetical protein [Cyanomargarita calcarea GSE-NOS-MK-12-04C]
MISQKIQQLQDQIDHEMKEALNNSNLGEILNKFGVTGDFIKSQLTIDLTKIQFIDPVEDKQFEKYLPTIPESQIVTLSCCKKGVCLCCLCG